MKPEARLPSDAALVLAFLAGPVAFGLELLVSYALVPQALHSHRKLALHLVTAVALAVSVGTTAFGAMAYSACAAAPPEGDPARAHRRVFLALGAIGMGAFCSLLMCGNEIGKFVHAVTD